MSEITFDDEHDLLTFRYTEPSTWWVSVPREQKLDMLRVGVTREVAHP